MACAAVAQPFDEVSAPIPSRAPAGIGSKRRFVVTEVARVVGGVLLGVAVVVIIPLVGSTSTSSVIDRILALAENDTSDALEVKP